MPPKGHAILSASSSDRWLHCPPSARLCETYKDKGSDYAAEGTDAHELCEYKLKRALGMDASDPTENLTWYNEDATEKLFFHTIYSVSKLIDVLYFVLIYTQKGLFQWPSTRKWRTVPMAMPPTSLKW